LAALSFPPRRSSDLSFFSSQGTNPKSAFLVARRDDVVVGYIIGTVRAWEFGSPPAGWIHAIGVDPSARKHGTGTMLFREMVAFLDRKSTRLNSSHVK